MNGQDELRELWRSQPPGGKTKGEDLVAMVQRKTRHFDRMTSVGILMECIAGVAVAFCFGFFAVRAHNALERSGCLIVAASAVWIIFYMLRYARSQSNVDPSQNLTGYTQALLHRYEHQIRLHKSVKYWYLLPLYVGLLVGTAGFFVERAESGRLSWQDLVGPAFYTAVFAVVWWLNEVNAVGRLRKQRARLLAKTGEGEEKAE